eukprot:Skav225572  [mRNA]  locus=scaffold81:520800:522245:+ [translate_table: standard]
MSLVEAGECPQMILLELRSALPPIGRLKRRGEHIGRGYAEEKPLSTPRPPPESDRPKTVPKMVPSAVTWKKARGEEDVTEGLSKRRKGNQLKKSMRVIGNVNMFTSAEIDVRK